MTPAIQPATSSLTLVPLSPAETDTPPPAQAKQPKERHVTVTPRSLPRGKSYVNVPQIILRGLYLEKTGFKIGDKVTVIQRPGQLIIHHDTTRPKIPAITAEDKILARKLGELKRYTENTAGEPLPCPGDVFADYLRDNLPPAFQEIISRFLNGHIPYPLRKSVIKLLNSRECRENQQALAENFLYAAAPKGRL